MNVSQALRRALEHHQAGRLEAAAALYGRVLEQAPDNADARHLLGVVSHQQGDPETACRLIGEAVRGEPGHFLAWNNLGNAQAELGRVEEAEESYRKATRLNPDYAGAHNNLGNVLKRSGRLEGAEEHFARAVSLDGGFVEALSNLGGALLEAGRVEEAETHCRRALEISPDYPEALANLGNVLADRGEYGQAETHLRRAAALKPDDADILVNLANVLKDSGRLDEARARYRRALSMDGQNAHAHYNLAMADLTQGRLQEGFQGFEWRWNAGGMVVERDFPGQPWRGEPLNGRTILIYAEQGLGDTIQFCRYLPLLLERGGRVVFECQPPLVELISAMDERLVVFPQGAPPPPYDLIHAPLLSLPRLLGTTLESIPAAVPYLCADGPRLEDWGRRLAEFSGPRVGLVWRGGTFFRNDRNRSASLAPFARHFTQDGIKFFSLQKERPDFEAELPGHFVDLGRDFETFSDTAAALMTLDLVISTCTSVPHLAGALGVPTWLLLSHPCDWRWMLARDDSPWYPTLTLFRKQPGEDWDSLLQKVTARLNTMDWTRR